MMDLMRRVIGGKRKKLAVVPLFCQYGITVKFQLPTIPCLAVSVNPLVPDSRHARDIPQYEMVYPVMGRVYHERLESRGVK